MQGKFRNTDKIVISPFHLILHTNYETLYKATMTCKADLEFAPALGKAVLKTRIALFCLAAGLQQCVDLQRIRLSSSPESLEKDFYFYFKFLFYFKCKSSGCSLSCVVMLHSPYKPF